MTVFRIPNCKQLSSDGILPISRGAGVDRQQARVSGTIQYKVDRQQAIVSGTIIYTVDRQQAIVIGTILLCLFVEP